LRVSRSGFRGCSTNSHRRNSSDGTFSPRPYLNDENSGRNCSPKCGASRGASSEKLLANPLSPPERTVEHRSRSGRRRPWRWMPKRAAGGSHRPARAHGFAVRDRTATSTARGGDLAVTLGRGWNRFPPSAIASNHRERRAPRERSSRRGVTSHACQTGDLALLFETLPDELIERGSSDE